VGQQVTPRFARGIFLPGSGASLLARADGRKNTIRRQPDEVTWVMQMRDGSAEADGTRPEIILVGQLLKLEPFLLDRALLFIIWCKGSCVCKS
jgi:hypothetical protein